MTDARSTSAGDAAPATRIRMSSDEMFRGRREVVIVHGGQEYLLRITKSDKLILTK
jgi:hemin uptake protein HemP